MTQRASRRFTRSIELLLWTAAVLCFGVIAWEQLLAQRSNIAAQQIVAGSQARSDDNSSVVDRAAGVTVSGQVIGRLRIAALGVSVPVTAGVESSSLLRGVGHVEGTAFPGGLGTLALAGHRDTYLRPLERVAKNMDVEVSDKSGTYHYAVDSWEIVTPEEVNVLSIRARPELVLITCYPFHYIGAAPNRFVVHAHLVSLAPDAPPSTKASMNGSL